jgi:hypothetical protein
MGVAYSGGASYRASGADVGVVGSLRFVHQEVRWAAERRRHGSTCRCDSLIVRVFSSADIEGVAGITAREEATKDRPGLRDGPDQMDAEVPASEGALAAGATDVWSRTLTATAASCRQAP